MLYFNPRLGNLFSRVLNLKYFQPMFTKSFTEGEKAGEICPWHTRAQNPGQWRVVGGDAGFPLDYFFDTNQCWLKGRGGVRKINFPFTMCLPFPP